MADYNNNINLTPEIQTITLKPNEVLLVRLPKGTSQNVTRIWAEKLKACLNSDKILVYSSDRIDFLKIALEEKLIDKLVDDEIQK